MVNRFLAVLLLVWLGFALPLPAQQSEASRRFFRETKAKADKGDAEAQLALGNLYSSGTGVAKDAARGVKWHRKAAEQGLARAQHQLGLEYSAGIGVTKDDAEAFLWFLKAAEQGLPEAQFDAGLCLVNGEGVKANGVEGVQWFRKAAAEGLVDAEYQIGKCYLEGTGVARDITQALKWIRQAAEKGFPAAQNSLGLCYEKGVGVEKDPVQAYKWFVLAAAQDDEHAADIRVSMAKAEAALTKDQIVEAQRLASEFKPAAKADQRSGSTAPGPQAAIPSSTGIINVTADQDHSEVYADGAFVGNPPAKLKLPAGTHVIEVKNPGCRTYRREIKVSAGSDLTLRAVLQKE